MYASASTAQHVKTKTRQRHERQHAARNGRVYELPGKLGHPMEEDELATLRAELKHQAWLNDMQAFLKASGNKTRLSILYLLWRRGEVRVNDLAEMFKLTVPAISQHLKKLRTSSLVKTRRDAQASYYRLNMESEYVQCLVTMFEEHLP